MAKRKTFFTVKSEDIQGEGSYVRVLPVTLAEAKRNKANLQPIQDQIETLKQGGDPDGKLPALEEKLTTLNMDFLRDHIVGWDWVDDNDQPLPLPKDDPGVLDQLYTHELEFLGQAVAGTLNQKK